jgi:hypothetical protein
MLAGLEPKNFACVMDPELGSSCALHLIVLRINILPDELEFVFAAEDDAFEKVFFHQNLPAVVAGLVPDATVPQLCWQPLGRPDGSVAMTVHGYESLDL